MEVCQSLRRERGLKLPCLSKACDDGDAGLGDRPPLLELPEHPPEQGLVIIQIFVDASAGVAGPGLGAEQLVELDTAGDGQLLTAASSALLFIWLLMLLLLLMEGVRSISRA